jgi:hypothetical protein
MVVTAAASVSFFTREFDDFLYAPIGADGNDMPLTVLSGLSRLGVDPWKEAAELCELPRHTASQRLASLIARLPSERWAKADAKAIADRLLEFLPHRSLSKVQSTEKAHGLQQLTRSPIVLICVALGLAALIIAANRESSSRGDHADLPASTTASPPQTSVPSSR